MKKIYYIIIPIIIISISLILFGYSTPVTSTLDSFNPTPTPVSISTQILEKLTLEEKIGQILFISYRSSSTLNTELSELLTTTKPGGFILFKENLEEYNQAKTFINDIQNTSAIPLFIGIDEEGGKIDRFSNMKNYSYEKIKPMLEIGKTSNYNEAYQTGKNIASLLKEFNINLDFAPVLDVIDNENNTVIGNRSFGTDPTLVANMGYFLAQGLSDEGIIPVFKHFPGHGSTTLDSHVDLPIINKTKEELLKHDLIPYQKVINNNAQVIMVGHLTLPGITNNYLPASLSKDIIDILKNDLNYQNLIITDALNMKALTNYYSKEDIYINAIKAGVDILLMPTDPNTVINVIKNEVENGNIPLDQINESVLKILKLKEKYHILTEIKE